MIWPILEARAEIQKYFRSLFGSNEDIQKSFWNYLTFRGEKLRYDDGAYASSSTPGNFKLRCVWDLGYGMILRMRDDMLPPLTDCIPVQRASKKYVVNMEGQRGQISLKLADGQ